MISLSNLEGTEFRAQVEGDTSRQTDRQGSSGKTGLAPWSIDDGHDDR